VLPHYEGQFQAFVKRIKSMIRKRASLAAGLFVCALPVCALVPGCGGGGDGAVVVPTPGPGQSVSAPVNFGNGQTGTLNFVRNGNVLTGTLVVAQGSTGSQVIPAGTYEFTGTVNSQRNYEVTGTLPGQIGQFRVTGLFPTTTSTGTYTLTFSGQTITGILPVLPTGSSGS
jgi:hypothetical protein